MKRILAFITALLVLLSAFSLAACGGPSDEVNEHNVALLEARRDQFEDHPKDKSFEKVETYAIIRGDKIIDARLNNGKSRNDKWTDEDVDGIDVIVYTSTSWNRQKYSATGKTDSEVYTCEFEDVSLHFYDNRTKKFIGIANANYDPPKTVKKTSKFYVSDGKVIAEAKDFMGVFRFKAFYLLYVLAGLAVVCVIGGIITAVVKAKKEKKQPPQYTFSFAVDAVETEDRAVTAYGNITYGGIEIGDRVNVYDADGNMIIEKALVRSLQNRLGQNAASIKHDETAFTLSDDVIRGTVCIECDTPDAVKVGCTLAVPIKKPAV